MIQFTEPLLLFFFFCKIWRERAGKHFMLFRKTKKGKPPPPKQAAKDISVVTEQLFRLERLELWVWLLCDEQKVQPCPDQWLSLPSRLGLFKMLPCSSCSPVSLQWGQDYVLPALRISKLKLFPFSPFIKIFVFGDSATSNSCLHWPFSLQLPSSVHLPVSARGTQVHVKMWQFSLLMQLRLLMLLTVLPCSTIFSPGRVSGNFAFSFNQSKISSVIFRYRHEFVPSFITSACSATCFLYSLSSWFLFLPMLFPLKDVLWSKSL